MPGDADNPFEPRLGRPRNAGSPRGRRYLHRVLAAAARSGPASGSGRSRFTGSRIGRGTVAARLLAGRPGPARRAMVKTRLVRIGGRVGAMRAHLRYLERDGDAVGDDERGRLYGPGSDDVDGRAFIERCAGDRHQFRLILSPEDGDRYDDLRPLVRRFSGRLEQDLGTALEWVAVDHADTLHPHSHVILRGRDDQGGNLVIAPDYIAHGMRERLAELVTLDLGPRSELERLAQQRRDVGAERLGERGDIIRTLQRALTRAGAARAAADQLVFDPQAGQRLVGRVVARGLADELNDRHYLIIDGIDGRSRVDGQAGALDQRLKSLFPGGIDQAMKSDQVLAGARARLDRAMAGFRDSMRVQAEVVANVREDSGLLGELVERSQSAVGTLQAAQATNQLLALSAKQQLQLQQLLAAEFRGASLDRARRQQSEEDARAATRRFLGTAEPRRP